MFPRSKDPSTFMSRVSLLGAITAVVENYTTRTMLNDRSLLVGDLKMSHGIGIVAVGGDDHLPIHVGTAEISIKEDKNTSIVSKFQPHFIFHHHQ